VLGASRGCTAVLRCVVPSFVKDLIRVVSWVQEPSFFIYPSLLGGKFGCAVKVTTFGGVGTSVDPTTLRVPVCMWSASVIR